MKTKRCYGCKQDLPIENFTKNKNNDDGLSYYCRKCSKKNYNLNKYKYSDNKKNYEGVIIDELEKYNITIHGLDIDKISKLRIHLIDMPGVIRPLMKELPAFLIKYDLTYEEYDFIIQKCSENAFWIEEKKD